MSETFTLHVCDLDHPYRRWQLIDSSAQPGDRVDVSFADTSGYLHRILGTYLGRAHGATQAHSNPQSGGDNQQIVVIVDTHHRWMNGGPVSEHRWGAPGTVGSVPYVLDTKTIRTFEMVDGPTLFDKPAAIDEGALRQAITDALGHVSTEGLVQDVVDSYTCLTD